MDLGHYIERLRQRGIGYVFTNTIPWHLNNVLDRVVGGLSGPLFSRLPLRDAIVLESHDDFDSNGGAFYDWLVRNGYNRRYRIVWLLNHPAPPGLPENVVTARLVGPSLRRWYYLYTSRYILCCHHIIGDRRPGQTSVYMTHGSFSLKRVSSFMEIPPSLDWILIGSANVAPLQAVQFGLPWPNDRFAVTGFPVLDRLYSDEPGDLHKVTHESYEKVILWMPTFRRNKDGMRNDSAVDEPLGVPVFREASELGELNERLARANALLIVKIHPMQDLSVVRVPELSNVVVLDAAAVRRLGVDNYRLMRDCDALVSDYSSAGMEFIHLDRPVGYTVDDEGAYKLGFVVDDPEPLMGGTIIHDVDEFTGFVDDVLAGRDPYRAKRHKVLDYLYEYHDGCSCERVARLIGLLTPKPQESSNG